MADIKAVDITLAGITVPAFWAPRVTAVAGMVVTVAADTQAAADMRAAAATGGTDRLLNGRA